MNVRHIDDSRITYVHQHSYAHMHRDILYYIILYNYYTILNYTIMLYNIIRTCIISCAYVWNRLFDMHECFRFEKRRVVAAASKVLLV